MGYQNAFLVAAFVALAQTSLFFAFIKWGPDLRKASVPRYLKYLEQIEGAGLKH